MTVLMIVGGAILGLVLAGVFAVPFILDGWRVGLVVLLLTSALVALVVLASLLLTGVIA